MKKLNKAKKSGGELLAVNMYKEYRDVTINGAVSQMYSEMAGRHRAHPNTIQIINTATLKASECKRDHVLEMHDSKLKYPIIRKMPMVAKKLRTTFKASRPMTFVR